MTITITAEKRDVFGKNSSRRLRKKGRLPAVLYGGAEGPVSLDLDKKDIFRIMKTQAGENTLLKITVGSEEGDVMIKDIQIDPVSHEVLHADLIRIAMDKLLEVTVPIVPVGEAVGVKTEGGFLETLNREVEVQCLPGDIPESIEIDIRNLHLHDSIKVSDVTPPEGVRILTDPSTVLVLIDVPRVEEVEKPEEAEIEEAAEEQEPEVIKKERGAEEEKD